MPTQTDLSLDTVQLSNLSIQLSPTLDGYLAETIFPVFQVDKKDGNYYVFDNAHFRIDNAVRAAGGRANRADYGLTTASYGPLEDFEYETPLDDFMVQQSPIDLAAAAVKFVTKKMLTFKEDKLSTLLGSTANVTQNTTLSGTSQWSDHTNSTPFTNIQTAISTCISGSGVKPNTFWCGQQVWDQLVNHPDLVERVKYTYGNTANKMSITPEELGNILGLRVLVGSQIKESADEGATSSKAFIWGKKAWVSYIDSAPSLMGMTAGLHFQLSNARKVDTYRDDAIRSNVIRIVDFFNPKIVSTGAIYLIADAVA